MTMLRLRLRDLTLAGALLCAACSGPDQQQGSNAPATGAPAPIAAQVTTPGLDGTSWRLVRFQGGDDTVLTPDEKTKYTMAFDAEGRVSMRIDCNRGSGTWESSGPSQLRFGPLALTRAMCPPAPLNERLARDWDYVRSYVMKDGHLFLSLMADGGIYEFEPASNQ
jgi:para-nitrobenzyl esterase